MSEILCIYYSRTGNTKKAMEEIASALDAELVELRDGVERSGWKGWLRCGLDSMRQTTAPTLPVETARPLADYRLVIVGTPVQLCCPCLFKSARQRAETRGICAHPKQ